MNNVIVRKVTVTDEWQRISLDRLVASVTISAAPGNANAVHFMSLDDPGHEVPLVPGEWHVFRRIDLNQIVVKGEAGDLVTAVGGTW